MSAYVLASNSTGSWILNSLGNFHWDDTYTSLAIDNGNDLHLAVFNTSSLTLEYFSNKSGPIISEMLDLSEEGATATGMLDNKQVGTYSSMVVDQSGFQHISYTKEGSLNGQGNLMYATNISGKWVWTELTGSFNPVWQNTIGLDSNGHVHIVYRKSVDVYYITNKTGAWITELVERSNLTADHDGKPIGKIGLQIDSNNDVHIGYMNYSGDVRYATNKSGGWLIEAVDTTGENFGNFTEYSVALNIDVAGKIHMAYLNRDANVAYTSNISNFWVTQIIATRDPVNPWFSNEIQVDSLGHVHMVYESPSCSPFTCFPDKLRYASNISGVWTNEIIDDEGFLVTVAGKIAKLTLRDPSLDIDKTGNIYIAYVSEYSDNIQTPAVFEVDIRSAYRPGEIWRTNSIEFANYLRPPSSTVENGHVYLSVKNDGYGNAYLSFYDDANGGLKLGRSNKIPSPLLDATVIPRSSDYGLVNLGEVATRDIRLDNIGQMDLVVAGIHLSGSNIDQFNLDLNAGTKPCNNITINLIPNGYCTMQLLFMPTQDGPSDVIMIIDSNDPELQLVAAGFKGSGAADLSISSEESSGGGGGCSMGSSRTIDPVIPIIWLWAFLSLAFRAYKTIRGPKYKFINQQRQP